MFGHSLSDEDKHIATALSEGVPRVVAVSIYPRNTELSIIQEKARIAELMGNNKTIFFDSTTHPLGDPCLTIP